MIDANAIRQSLTLTAYAAAGFVAGVLAARLRTHQAARMNWLLRLLWRLYFRAAGPRPMR